MDTKQLGNMVIFIFGFLLLWAAMRMAWVLARPQVQSVSPMAAQATDFVLM
jgi:hypothetical protein